MYWDVNRCGFRPCPTGALVLITDDKFRCTLLSSQMKKRQMKAQLIMESKGVNFQVIDICDPNNEDERTFMRKNAVGRNNARNAVPPQFFNDDHEDSYCGVRNHFKNSLNVSS